MRIDVYDFDGTLFDGESTGAFWRYGLRRRPSLLRFLPEQLLGGLLFLMDAQALTVAKRHFLCFLRGVDAGAMAQDFWSDPRRLRRLAPWLRRAPGDIPFAIASASPAFLVAPAARRLGADVLVATRADPRTGLIRGENCRGEEKIRRLREALGDFSVRAMYTDDPVSDAPLLAMAEERYLVRHGRVTRMD